MHDWTLLSIEMDWGAGSALLRFETRDVGKQGIVRASGVVSLIVPRQEPWGRSVSVNSVSELEGMEGELRCIQIQMQSGDTIVLQAASFELPY